MKLLAPAVLGRLLLVVGSIVFALLLFEGVASLAGGHSVAARIVSTAGPYGPRGPSDDYPADVYALDRDPEVGYRLQSTTTSSFAGVPATTDEHGDRRRIGPALGPSAPRIVVLGDSVAFGLGVADDETYAHQLEQLLAGALQPGAVQPVVQTVAVPGWNYGNSFQYLRSHLRRLDPDIVLYLAVANDLDDGLGVDERGRLASGLDVGPSRPHCSGLASALLLMSLDNRAAQTQALELAAASGLEALEPALRSGVTPESRRRWKDYLAAIAALDRDLAARGTRFAVVLPWAHGFHRSLGLQLRPFAPHLPVVGLLDEKRKADSLPRDGHPNPRCIAAGAHALARFLARGTWLDSLDPSALPTAPAAYAGRDYPPLSAAERKRYLPERRAQLGRFIGAELNLSQAHGIHQVYGGLMGDGTVGRHVYFALQHPAPRALKLTLERLPADSALYPLWMSVQLQGRPLASFNVPAPAVDESPVWTRRVELPPGFHGPYYDVLLRSSTRVLVEGRLGTHPTSLRLLRATLVGDRAADAAAEVDHPARPARVRQ